MPVDLHQRLSEFSYGYGVTREVEQSLRAIGLRPTPFLPSLIQEAKVGFDVLFDRPGIPLLLQFKLGEAVQRFVRTDKTKPAPQLKRPFWRFSVDTEEVNGQFDLLLKWEQAGSEVYYVAPRFASWEAYLEAFQNDSILEQSLLIGPANIDNALAGVGEPDGWHRIVYDDDAVFVCSEPAQLKEVTARQIAYAVQHRIGQDTQSIGERLRRAYSALEERRAVRKRKLETDSQDQHIAEEEPGR
jgi:hypothetical protein